MEVTLTIPDEVLPDLQDGSAKPLARRVLELIALDCYKSGELTSPQVQAMLGFESGFELDGFLKAHGVFFDYSPEEIAEELETIKMLQAPNPERGGWRLGRTRSMKHRPLAS